jgi:signal transduction histidine kinase
MATTITSTTRPGTRSRLMTWRAFYASRWFDVVVGAVALAATAITVWLTLRADFLAYPGWLALQKADVILGPIGVGLYWRRRRPGSRFGPLLIAFGFLGVPYVLQSAATPALFGIGVLWELVIFVATQAMILAFPTGRLDGLAERLIIAVATFAVALPATVAELVAPHFGPDGSISGCLAVCPRNGLAIWSHPAFALTLLDFSFGALIAVALATGAVIVWRFVTGTPPRRRALAIGAPIALVFIVLQATFNAIKLFDVNAPGLHSAVQWAFTASRSLLWYGWLAALIAAELFASRVMRRIVSESLRRPSLHELEAMLRRPLGDPGLRLGFRDGATDRLLDAAGEPLAVPEPSSGKTLTEFDLNGRPAAAIVHDVQLDDDPELLQAAGGVALLARENAELHAAWNQSLRELADSRARIAAASDAERRKLERDLHDGAQQRLLAVLLKLDLASGLVADRPEVQQTLNRLGRELEEAIDELRELGHGIYPTLLANSGLVTALRSLAGRSAGRIAFTNDHVNGLPTEVEAPIYYCCLEAVQNATKHAGAASAIAIRLSADADELHLEVRDRGSGFDVSRAHDGVGLRNMRDRVGAVNGRLEIDSTRGLGTVVRASVPIGT